MASACEKDGAGLTMNRRTGKCCLFIIFFILARFMGSTGKWAPRQGLG